MPEDIDVLNKKIKALARSTPEKLTILKYLAEQKEDGAEFQEIVNKLSCAKDSTIYAYLKQLENSGFIRLLKGVKMNRYYLASTSLSFNLVDNHPLIRQTIGDVKKPEEGKWNEKYIHNSLMRVLSLNSTVAKEVTDETTEIINKIGLQYLSKSTIRYLICDVLYNKDLKKESYVYTPLGVPEENLKDYLSEPHYSSYHKRNIGEYMTKIYMIRQIPHDIVEFMKLSKPFFYIHNLENILSPLNITHDIRLLFKDGLNVNKHFSRPPRYLNVALMQTIGLLEFANNDCGRTQSLSHLNYYLSPFLEKDKIDHKKQVNLLDGFIKGLFRSFITRPRDYIYSGIQLDFDSVGVEDQNVVINGQTEEETYANYKETARELFKAFLVAYSQGYESSTYYYPRIVIGVDRHNVQELLDDDDIMNYLFKLHTNPDTESIYFLNRSSDVGYLPDLTRVKTLGELRSTGCLLAVSLNVLGYEQKIYDEGIESIASKLEESLVYIADLAIWKKRKLIERMQKDEFMIIGSNWRSIKPETYFDTNDSSVCVRLFGLNKLIKKLEYTNEENAIKDIEEKIIKKLNTKMNELKKYMNIENFVLAQTPSKSDAIRAFNQKGNDHISIFSPIISDSDRDTFKKKIELEANVQKLLQGGAVTRIFFRPDKYEIDDFKEDIQLSFDKGIELLNFRDIYNS